MVGWDLLPVISILIKASIETSSVLKCGTVQKLLRVKTKLIFYWIFAQILADFGKDYGEMKKTAKIQVKKMSPNLARIQAGIQLNKKSPNLAKILVILLNLSLKLSLKSAKMQRNHPNFRIFNRKSGPSPIWSPPLTCLLVWSVQI